MNRAFDLLVAVPAMLATAPLVAVLASFVKLGSGGPALFRQTRIGQHRRPFTLFKLRTMVQNSDALGPHITEGGADRRITPFGRILRKTKLDELPQLWNVVRGDMSLVGPRPEVPPYVAFYRPEWNRAFDVRPGITDIASIAFRNEEELIALATDTERAYVDAILPAKVPLAIEGIERSSFAYDLGLLLKTSAAVLRLWRPPLHPAFSSARRAILDGHAGRAAGTARISTEVN